MTYGAPNHFGFRSILEVGLNVEDGADFAVVNVAELVLSGYNVGPVIKKNGINQGIHYDHLIVTSVLAWSLPWGYLVQGRCRRTKIESVKFVA